MKSRRATEPGVGARASRIGVLLAVTCALSLALPSPTLAGSEICIRVDVDRNVRLPHGKVLEPGTLTICREKLSPVTHLHRAAMDGQPVALLLSQTKVREIEGSLDPVVVFDLSRDGQLRLVGYTLPNGSEHAIHRFVRYGRSVETEVRVSEPQILIAAAYD